MAKRSVNSRAGWIICSLPTGFYTKHRAVPWVWVPISSRAEVSCLDSRHVHSQMQAIKKSAREISEVISFFEKTQEIPHNESFYPVRDEYFKCNKEILPLSILQSLSFKESMKVLGISNEECRDMQSLGTLYQNLFSNLRVKRPAGDVIDFILRNPSKDYGPVREALSHLKNNIILNHNIILHQDLNLFFFIFKLQFHSHPCPRNHFFWRSGCTENSIIGCLGKV